MGPLKASEYISFPWPQEYIYHCSILPHTFHSQSMIAHPREVESPRQCNTGRWNRWVLLEDTTLVSFSIHQETKSLHEKHQPAHASLQRGNCIG